MLLATLARLLLPSWAFFDRVGARAVLELRPAGAHDAAWRPALHAAPRRWWHVVWHPDGTAVLAAQDVVDRAAAEACDERPATPATRDQLTRLASACAPEAGAWAWRVVVQEPDGAAAAVLDGTVDRC
jgi:hypothetical protein